MRIRSFSCPPKLPSSRSSRTVSAVRPTPSAISTPMPSGSSLITLRRSSMVLAPNVSKLISGPPAANDDQPYHELSHFGTTALLVLAPAVRAKHLFVAAKLCEAAFPRLIRHGWCRPLPFHHHVARTVPAAANPRTSDNGPQKNFPYRPFPYRSGPFRDSADHEGRLHCRIQRSQAHEREGR